MLHKSLMQLISKPSLVPYSTSSHSFHSDIQQTTLTHFLSTPAVYLRKEHDLMRYQVHKPLGIQQHHLLVWVSLSRAPGRSRYRQPYLYRARNTTTPPPSVGLAFAGSGEIQMQAALPLPASLSVEMLIPRNPQKQDFCANILQ